MSNPINTLPIQQFIQQVKSAELSNQKEIKVDLKTAKNLVFCLSEITTKLVEDQDKLLAEIRSNSSTGTLDVKMDGGGFSTN
jgi:hypothetical protein